MLNILLAQQTQRKLEAATQHMNSKKKRKRLYNIKHRKLNTPTLQRKIK